jgi:hypothetical protein
MLPGPFLMLARITKSVVGLVPQHDMRARQNSPQAIVFCQAAMDAIQDLFHPTEFCAHGFAGYGPSLTLLADPPEVRKAIRSYPPVFSLPALVLTSARCAGPLPGRDPVWPAHFAGMEDFNPEYGTL